MLTYKVEDIYSLTSALVRMPTELTLETLDKNITEIKSAISGFTANEEEKNKKELEAKKAQDEKDEEKKMEAKKAKYDAAIKLAMDEDDHEKKDAAIKKAQEEYDHDKDKKEAFGKPDDNDKREGMTEDEKEHVASIVEKDRQTMIKQILTAATIATPEKFTEIEALVKDASISDLKKLQLLTPTFKASVPTVQTTEKVIPFFANIQSNQNIDSKMLTAASPDSAFNTMTTKELLEMGQ